MNKVKVHDKYFSFYISDKKINEAIKHIAANINNDYTSTIPVLIPVLNGSFIFAADLLRALTIQCQVSFIKLASYHGTSSKGNVNEIIGINEDLAGRHVVILEDIIDTGLTIVKTIEKLKEKNPASITIASLFIKPANIDHKVDIKYPGLKISNDFIIGYGLDYKGLGRNFVHLYRECEG